MPAEGDPENRCSNCIRLKKECVYTPVDTNQATHSRAQQPQPRGSLGSNSSSSIVSTSPTDMGSMRSTDRDRAFGNILPLPSNVSQDYRLPLEPGSALGITAGGKHHSQPEPRSGPNLFSGSMYGSGFSGYAADTASQTSWSAGPYNNQSEHHDSANIWNRSRDNPAMADFSPFPSGPDGFAPNSLPSHHSFSYMPRDDHGMHPPGRSMSYGNTDNLSGFTQPMTVSQDGLPRQLPSLNYPPPSLDATSTRSSISTSESQPTPVGHLQAYGLPHTPWSYYPDQQHIGHVTGPPPDSLGGPWLSPTQLSHAPDGIHMDSRSPLDSRSPALPNPPKS